MRHHLTLAAAIAALAGAALTTTPAEAVQRQEGPSFNCARAQTRVERMICADPALSERDAAMARAYSATRLRLRRNSEVQALLRDQRLWLRDRNGCSTRGCLMRMYEDRINVLTNEW